MGMASNNQTEEKKKQPESTEENANGSMQYAIIGGVVGAGLGLLSNPGTTKKMAASLGKSELMKAATKELRRTAQEFVTEQAMISLRQTASGYFNKMDSGVLSPLKNKLIDKKDSGEKESQNDEIKQIKADNQDLNERLERIEEMLNKLVDSKK